MIFCNAFPIRNSLSTTTQRTKHKMATRSLSRLFKPSNTLRQRQICPHTLSIRQTTRIQRPFYLRNAATRSFALSSRRFQDGLKSNRDLNGDVSTTSPQSIQTSDVELLETLAPENPDQPSYALVFTCKSCTHRSAHRISKQGYHHGSVLVQCPGCKGRHLIADHLKVFGDSKVTLEQILAQKGDLLQKGGIGVDGDMELWDSKDAAETKAIG
jgi:hypothetical protein